MDNKHQPLILENEQPEISEIIEKKAKRSKRRYKRAVKLTKRLKRLFWAPRQPGILAKTAKPCSCYMCGNRRKYEGPSVAELKKTFPVDSIEIEEEVLFYALNPEE